ncbi:MAG: alpha-L-arabinofuranosidase C-terminal domain-containing protein [Fidelibacterota bacterium]
MIRYFNFLIVVVVFISCIGCMQNEDLISIKVNNNKVAELDYRIFGQFIEKPSWGGEWGPEAALKPGTHDLQNGVEELMQKMHIPVLRFPGGTDVNFQDWRTLIDNVPDRDGDRPVFVGHAGDTVTNNFGYDEVCQLAERLGSEMMIVVNFGDAYYKKKSIEAAVRHEMGLLAYLNLAVGADLPDWMADWPSIRARNGHPEPYNIRYVQIANEPWVMDRDLKQYDAIDSEKKDHYFACLDKFIEMIEKIDPEVEIIADGNSEELTTPLREKYGGRIDYLAYHRYLPWGIQEVLKNGDPVHADSLTAEEVWKTWVAIPDFNDNGYSTVEDEKFKRLKESGYPIAVTEWNWNGWWATETKKHSNSHFTQGIGAAGYLHGLMRNAEHVAIGNQSMLVGRSWGITGIRVSETEAFKPYPHSTAEITGFYSKYHGGSMMELETQNIPCYAQPYQMAAIMPRDSVAILDVLATAGNDRVYVHVINREYNKDMPVELDLTEFRKIKNGRLHTYTGNIENEFVSKVVNAYGRVLSKSLKVSRNKAEVMLPKRSASILEFQLED